MAEQAVFVITPWQRVYEWLFGHLPWQGWMVRRSHWPFYQLYIYLAAMAYHCEAVRDYRQQPGDHWPEVA